MRISVLFIFSLIIGLLMAGCVEEVKSISINDNSIKNKMSVKNNYDNSKNNSLNNSLNNSAENEVLRLVNVQTNQVTLNVQNYY